MDRYLKQIGKRRLFDDPEYFTALGKLSEAAGDREITALIARMYAEQMIAAKETGAGDQSTRRELPCNLPDLMLGYVKRLNDQVQADKQDFQRVIGVARTAAWECLKQTCRPTAAKRECVLEALRNETDAEALLKYLEERLHLIQTVNANSDLVRFSLDPLAEYLAALYLVERYSKREELWMEFIDLAKNEQNVPGAAESIKDFLLAVRDCCMEKGDEHRMPEWIKGELVRLSGLDPAVVITAQIKQRVTQWIANLKSTNSEDRRIAAQALGQLGVKAKEGVPALIIALKDREAVVRNAVVSALAQIGPPAVPSLINALRDRDAEVCRAAAAALAQIGPPAVPALITALEDQETVVRRSAASVLGQIGPEAKEAMTALIDVLDDHDVEARRSAASALGQIGPEAQEAVPALIIVLRDQDAAVRRSAAAALGQIGPEAKQGIPALITALTDREAVVRNAAAAALGKIGSPAVPALITALKDQEAVVRGSAAFALGQVEPKAKEAVPVLITALTDQNTEVWRPVASALGQIGPEAKEAVPALMVALKDRDEAVRRPAAEALGKIGPAAVPALINALKDPDAAVRSSAVYALWQIGPDAKDAVPVLIVALKDQDPEVRSSVAAALRRIGAGVE
jgi:HEAT repeat protein